MGVPGLWEVLRPAASTKSLTQLAVADGFDANLGGHRGFRIGIDASIWFFHAQVFKGMKTDVGENPELRTLFFRCAKLMNTPLLPLFVFDGPKRPQWKRGKRVSTKKDSWLVTGMQNIINAFGYEWRYAPGEAEAELAYLNRIGVIDAVLTDDVDTFLFGATMIIRNPSNTLSGNRANPIKNAEGRDDGNHVLAFKADDLRSHDDIQLTQGGLILIGLLRGGDYHQAGVQGVGVTIAHGLARCGFGDSLVEAVRTMTGPALDAFLDTWREDMQHELRTNSRGIIGKKLAKLASSFPQDFPDLKVIDAYVNPIVSASTGEITTIEWRREPNLSDLGKLCEQYFEWGYREAILKRFRTVIWPGAVCRILRRSVLQADDIESASRRHAVQGTPRKHVARDELALGTPSKMITQYFSRLELDSPHVRAFDAPDAPPLIKKIHSERRNACTDKLKEYRLEIAPLQLACLAEQSLTGSRSAPAVNPYLDSADEEEDDEDDEGEDGAKKKKGKRVPKPPPDPETVLRVWMPASMVELVEPRLVRDYEEVKERKRLKKEGKAVPKERKTKATKDAPKKAATRKPKAAKNKYFSDSGSGSDSEADIENIPISRGRSSAMAESTAGQRTMDAPPPKLSALNATNLFARPAAKGKILASSTANSSSSRSKTAAVAEMFAPSPVKQNTEGGFFSDEDGNPCTNKKAPETKKRVPLFYPSSSDEEDVFQVPAIPTLYPHDDVHTHTHNSQKRESNRTPSDIESDADALRKSPRKSKLQTSPRADRQRRVEPLSYTRPSAEAESDQRIRPKLAPFPMRAVPKSKVSAATRHAPAARKPVDADVIVISSSDDDQAQPMKGRPMVHAPVRCVDGVIDLT